MNISPDLDPSDRFTFETVRTDSGRIREVVLHDVHTGKDRYFKTKKAAEAGIVDVLRTEVSPQVAANIREEVKNALHCCRDTMRIRGLDTTTQRFAGNIDSGRAYGIIQGVAMMGVGDLHQLQSLLRELEDEVLAEEGYNGDNVCTRCYNKYKRDGARPLSSSSV